MPYPPPTIVPLLRKPQSWMSSIDCSFSLLIVGIRVNIALCVAIVQHGFYSTITLNSPVPAHGSEY